MEGGGGGGESANHADKAAAGQYAAPTGYSSSSGGPNWHVLLSDMAASLLDIDSIVADGDSPVQSRTTSCSQLDSTLMEDINLPDSEDGLRSLSDFQKGEGSP